jgi:hypothetical protein
MRTRDQVEAEIAALQAELAALEFERECAAQGVRSTGEEIPRPDPEGNPNPVLTPQEG